VPSSGDGRVTVLELWLATDSAAEAADVEKALTRLQLRSYPDILALSQAFMTYSQMYEQCKADQIEACSQYTKMYLAVQVWALCNIAVWVLCNIARSANLAACHRVVMPPEPTPFRPTARSMSSARLTRLRPASSTAGCLLNLIVSLLCSTYTCDDGSSCRHYIIFKQDRELLHSSARQGYPFIMFSTDLWLRLNKSACTTYNVLKAHVCTSIEGDNCILAALPAAAAALEAGRGLTGDNNR